jgi:nicotinate-nucleotide pyrophosphorylase (carboxylating)
VGVPDLNLLPLPELYRELRATGLVARVVELARDEDLGGWRADDWETSGDPTSRAVATPMQRGRATLAVRLGKGGGGVVVAGLAVIGDVLDAFKADVDFVPAVRDGGRIGAAGVGGAEDDARGRVVLGELRGNVRGMLAAERTILNFVGRLSGIATRTAEFVAAVEGTGAKVLDTRKTTPGMRVLEKYAVRCGGGFMHRIGLYDAAMFKDNHLAELVANSGAWGMGGAGGKAGLAGELAAAVRRAHEAAGRAGLEFVEVEVDTLAQLEAILSAGGCGCSIVLLDNMGPAELREAVAMRDRLLPRVRLEASGGINLENVAEVARTGVDRISLGTLTHGARWVDVGLDWA